MMNHLAVAIARLDPIGKSPWFPGTMATAIVGMPAAWLLHLLPLAVAVIIVLFVFAIGWWASHLAAQVLGQEDPRQVVIDELLGYLVTMVGLPLNAGSLLIGFAAFRLFDIWKPWPVSSLDRKVGGGLGIMADDLAAGILAHGCTWGILRLMG